MQQIKNSAMYKTFANGQQHVKFTDVFCHADFPLYRNAKLLQLLSH